MQQLRIAPGRHFQVESAECRGVRTPSCSKFCMSSQNLANHITSHPHQPWAQKRLTPNLLNRCGTGQLREGDLWPSDRPDVAKGRKRGQSVVT